jgi:4-alpha-glucanotransferase
VGWFSTTSPRERLAVHTYTGTDGRNIAWDFIRLAFTSVANTAIVPLQDVLSLGTHARMNQPGRAGGNWGWRYRETMLSGELAQQLRALTMATGRQLMTTKTRG